MLGHQIIHSLAHNFFFPLHTQTHSLICSFFFLFTFWFIICSYFFFIYSFTMSHSFIHCCWLANHYWNKTLFTRSYTQSLMFFSSLTDSLNHWFTFLSDFPNGSRTVQLCLQLMDQSLFPLCKSTELWREFGFCNAVYWPHWQFAHWD